MYVVKNGLGTRNPRTHPILMIQNIMNSAFSRVSLITKRNRTNRVRSATNRDSSSIVCGIRLAQRKAMSTDECRNIASSNSSQVSSVTSRIRSKLIETSSLSSCTSRSCMGERNTLATCSIACRSTNVRTTSKHNRVSLASSSKCCRTNLNVGISILVSLTTRCNNTINTLS